MSLFKSIIALSLQDEKDDANPLVGSAAGDLITAARAKVKEEAQKGAAEELIKMLQQLDAVKAEKRTSLKQLRKRMAAVTEELDNIDLALEFGKETSNFLPLLDKLGMTYSIETELRRRGEFDYAEFTKLIKIPDGWKPKG